MAQPRPVDEGDAASLLEYLESFGPSFRSDTRSSLIEGGLPLWRQVLRYTPNPPVRGRALELGSPPFNISLLIARLRNYDLVTSGVSADGSPIVQELRSETYGDAFSFACDSFDIERDVFPYADASFDLVIMCEVIEHLAENPTHVLEQIYRVLKPGGRVLISTPNITRFDNIVKLVDGRNVFQQYHLGSPHKGSRHLREYTLDELRELVGGCGFEIERSDAVDLYPPQSARKRAVYWLARRLLSRLTRARYEAHLLCLARKTSAPFRPWFPPSIYAPQHLALHIRPVDTDVTMGMNDALHLGLGWGPITTLDGRAARRAGGVADLYLAAPPVARRVLLHVAHGTAEIHVAHHVSGAGAYLLVGYATVEAGDWREVEVAINQDYEPGNPLHVRIASPGGIDVSRVRIA